MFLGHQFTMMDTQFFLFFMDRKQTVSKHDTVQIVHS